MSLSITEIARLHKDFIIKQISEYESQLLPSSEEDQELVRRAVFSVRNKSVIFDRYIPFSTNLYTIVHDVKSPQVLIEFGLEKITCSCPNKGICRHKLAVLLSLYQYFNSVQDWAGNWRAKKNIQLATIAKERTPENWLTLINEVMTPHLGENKRIEGYAIMTIVDVARARLNRYMPIEREWITIYKLFCEVGIYKHIMQHFSKIAYFDSNQTYYLQYFADKAQNTISELVDKLSTQSKIFAIDPFYDALQQEVFDMLQTKTIFPAQQVQIYLLFWSKLFTSVDRALPELNRFEKGQQLLIQANIQISPLKVIFHMLLKDTQKIDELLASITPSEIELYLVAAQFAQTKNETSLCTKILQAVLPHLQYYLHEIVTPMQRQQIASKIVQLYDFIQLNGQDEMILYASLGKFGIQPFSLYLIKHKRYEDWAALHHMYNSSISYLEACGLKTVIDESPNTTLSLYHHYAMEELKQKSRINYKQAVKLWKHMRNAAKKAGKTAFFEDYMHLVRTKNKRLRALQEELDKGNF